MDHFDTPPCNKIQLLAKFIIIIGNIISRLKIFLTNLAQLTNYYNNVLIQRHSLQGKKPAVLNFNQMKTGYLFLP